MYKIEKALSQNKTVSLLPEKFCFEWKEIYKHSPQKVKALLRDIYPILFRKFYYAPMMDGTAITPASIIQYYVEKEFGAKYFVVPAVALKDIRTGDMTYHYSVVDLERHHIVDDLQVFMQYISQGMEVDAEGFVLKDEDYLFLNKHFLSAEVSYVRYINGLSLTMGLVRLGMSATGHRLSTTLKWNDFLNLTPARKLKKVIAASLEQTAKSLQGLHPSFETIFTKNYIEKILHHSQRIDDILEIGLSRAGKGFAAMEELLNDQKTEDSNQFEEEMTQLSSYIYSVSMAFDLYFTFVWGYVAGVILPVGLSMFDLQSEVATIVSSGDDPLAIGFCLSPLSNTFDVTSYGHHLLGHPGRTTPQNALHKMSEQEIRDIILNVAEVAKYSNYEINRSIDKYFLEVLNRFSSRAHVPSKPLKKKKITKKYSKNQNVLQILTEKNYIIKVKKINSKLTPKEISISDSKTLADLNMEIKRNFALEDEHLYSFFLSDRIWDASTEISHPYAEGIDAEEIQMQALNLKLHQKFKYVYDYGAEHRFQLEIIAVHS